MNTLRQQLIATFHGKKLTGLYLDEAYERIVDSLLDTLIANLPEEKHHIESDRNIAYREGWNDSLTEVKQTLLEAREEEK